MISGNVAEPAQLFSRAEIILCTVDDDVFKVVFHRYFGNYSVDWLDKS